MQRLGACLGEGIMDAKQYFTIAAILATIYGIGFLVIPANLLVLYGTPAPDSRIVLTAQYFGVALLGLGLTVWFVRNCPDAATVRGVLIANAIGDAVGFVITAWGMIQGLLNATAWTSLVIYAALALGAIYLLLAAPQRPTAASG
jgi:hypothetical protein